MDTEKEFDNIYRLYYSQLFYFAHQYIDDKDSCYDIVNDVYEELWRDFSSVHLSTVKSFLYTNVKNKCIDSLRHSSVHLQYVEYSQIMADSYVNEVKYEKIQEYEHIVSVVMAAIDPPTDEIFKECYLKEKSYKEMAEKMDISINTVKKHVMKALKIIRSLKIKNT